MLRAREQRRGASLGRNGFRCIYQNYSVGDVQVKSAKLPAVLHKETELSSCGNFGGEHVRMFGLGIPQHPDERGSLRSGCPELA